MSSENYWKHYLNIPVPVGGLSVSPLPVRLMDWYAFTDGGISYFKISYDLLRKRLKLDESVKLFDYLMSVLLESSTSLESDDISENRIKHFGQILSLCFRLPVEAMVLKSQGKANIVYRINGVDTDLITRDNFDEIRELIMEQNLIYEPIVAPNQKSQDIIDKAIMRLANSGSDVETNIESMLVLVSRHRDINGLDYTYYRLRADYEMELRLEQSRAIPTYRAVGADVPSIELGEVLSMHSDPYSKDKLFKRNDRTKDGELTKK